MTAQLSYGLHQHTYTHTHTHTHITSHAVHHTHHITATIPVTEALHLGGDEVQFCSVLFSVRLSWMHIDARCSPKLIASSHDIKSIKPASASRGRTQTPLWDRQDQRVIAYMNTQISPETVSQLFIRLTLYINQQQLWKLVTGLFPQPFSYRIS